MALHACAHAVRPICLKIPSNLLHMELTRTQVHIFLCTCVRVNSMCSKLEGIFKHIGLKAWADMHGVPWHFNSKKIKKISETHETLLDVMSCHQDDVVKKLACLTNVWTHTPHKPKQLIRRLVLPRGNNACLMTNRR